MRMALSVPARYEAPAPTALRPANDSYSKAMIGGIVTVCLSRDGLARMMLQDCMAARANIQCQPKLVFASNGHTIALAAKDPSFRKILEQADIIHADGQAAVFASRMTDSPIPERSATTDFIHDAARVAAQHGLRFFLLGTTEETNEKAARMLRAAYPGLQIVGRRHGYFSADEEEELCDEINLTQPDVIWVGLSAPLEYEFSVRNKTRLRAGWLVTCGGCYNFITGACKRAPRWMRAAGLEWLFRVVQEPRRLFWRYTVTNPLAIFLLLTRTTSLSDGAIGTP